jgi:putative OPT family oligopeptide transporter
MKITGDNGAHGMVGAILIGTVICIVTAMAGDTSQDLKTGYILGATPKKQQIGEIIGAIVSALTIGGVLVLLDKAWGFGTTELAAPQATLMKMIVEGVMNANLPWGLVFIGIFSAVVVEILGIPVLPVAIGLYLPLELSTTIMIGGIIRWFADKKAAKTGDKKNDEAGTGVLFCSGMIAGEGLVGIILAVLAVLGIDKMIDFSGSVNFGTIGGIILLIIMTGCVAKAALGKNADNKKEDAK